MEKQRLARQAALVKQLECGCPDSTCADGKSCSHPMRRITTAKQLIDNKRIDSNNQVTSTTPNVLVGQRLYPRWVDRRNRDHLPDLTHTNNNNNNNSTTTTTTQKIDGGSIHFQVIPTTSHTHISNISNQISTRSNTNTNTTTTSITINNSSLNNSNSSNNSTNNPTNNNSQLVNQNNNQLNRNMIINSNNNQQLTAVVTHSNSNQINLTTTGAINTRDNNILTSNDGHNISMSTNHILNHHQQHQQQQHQF